MKNFSVLLTIGLILTIGLFIASCSEDETTEVDSQAPEIRLIEPRDGVRVSGSTLVRATASDNSRVEVVQFYANGALIGLPDSESPYQVSWSPFPPVEGEDPVLGPVEFEIKAKAWDSAGNEAPSEIHTVTYFIDVIAPTISITVPSDLDTIRTATTTIRTIPADNDELLKVDFVVDSEIIGTVTEEPWEIEWIVGRWANDLAHTLTVKAWDISLNAGISEPVSVIVPILLSPPTVIIDAPGGGTLLTELEIFEVSTIDEDPVVKVDFFVDGELLGTDTEEPWEMPWELVYWADDQEHILEAEATDARQNVGISAPTVPIVAASVGLEAVFPDDGAIRPQDEVAEIEWETIDSAAEYEYEVARDDQFAEIAFGELTANTREDLGILTDGWYYWHARAKHPMGRWSEWSPTRRFHIGTIFAQTLGDGSHPSALLFVDQIDDGYILCGYLGSGDAAETYRNAYLVRTDPTGVVLWEQSYDAADESEMRCVRTLSDGGFVMAGYYEFTVPESDDPPTRDLWVIRTDASGNLIWDETYGGDGYDEAQSLLVDEVSGELTIIGYTTTPESGKDLWVLRTDGQGNELAGGSWIFGGAGDEEGAFIQPAGGGYIATGYTTSYGNGGEDIWLLKISSGGVLEWDSTKGLALDERGSCVREIVGGYIVSGTTESYGAGPSAGVVWQTDASGNEVWGRSYGTSGTNSLAFIQSVLDENTAGGYILVGTTSEVWAGQSDLWLLRIDDAGDEIWSNAYPPGLSEDFGTCVQSTRDSGFITGGGSSSFETNTFDLWMIKTSSTGQTVSFE